MSRARLVSAVAFGGAGALVAGGLVAAAFLSPGGPGPMTGPVVVWAPLAFGLPAALVGWLAGQRVAAAASAGAAALLGVGVTVAAAVVYVVGIFAVFLVIDVADGPPMDVDARELLVPEVWGIVLAVALALSPVGALAAVAARRWTRRSAERA